MSNAAIIAYVCLLCVAIVVIFRAAKSANDRRKRANEHWYDIVVSTDGLYLIGGLIAAGLLTGALVGEL